MPNSTQRPVPGPPWYRHLVPGHGRCPPQNAGPFVVYTVDHPVEVYRILLALTSESTNQQVPNFLDWSIDVYFYGIHPVPGYGIHPVLAYHSGDPSLSEQSWKSVGLTSTHPSNYRRLRCAAARTWRGPWFGLWEAFGVNSDQFATWLPVSQPQVGFSVCASFHSPPGSWNHLGGTMEKEQTTRDGQISRCRSRPWNGTLEDRGNTVGAKRVLRSRSSFCFPYGILPFHRLICLQSIAIAKRGYVDFGIDSVLNYGRPWPTNHVCSALSCCMNMAQTYAERIETGQGKRGHTYIQSGIQTVKGIWNYLRD